MMSTGLGNALPRCRVCQDPSSGLHYGVPTCTACKGFFGRCLRGQAEHRSCIKDNKCDIKGSNKNSCPSCRLRKCLEAGMSREAIKTGRYSLQKRHKLHLELKKSEHSVNYKCQDSSPTREPYVEIQACLSTTGTLGPFGESLEDMIAAISDAYRDLPTNIYRTQEEIDAKTLQYMEIRKLNQTLFGEMPKLTKEEFQDVHNETGLDIDGRIQFGERLLMVIRKWLGQVVSFAMCIPGFRQLPVEDQFNLLRYNRQEFWFISAYKGFNKKYETCVNPNGHCCHRSDIEKAFFRVVDEDIFDVAEAMKRLQLTSGEHILVQTLALLFPDRAPLRNRRAVERIQASILACLELQIEQHPNRRERVRSLAHAVDMLTAARHYYSSEHSQNSNHIIRDDIETRFIKESLRSILLGYPS